MKREVTIKTKQALSAAPKIRFETKARTTNVNKGDWACLISEGNVLRKLDYLPSGLDEHSSQAAERNKIHSIELNGFMTEGEKKIFFTTFTYFDTNSEAVENGLSPEDNDNIKVLLAFLKLHNEVSVKNEAGTELNPNVNFNLVKFDYIDNIAKIEKATETNFLVIDATSQLKSWFENDKQKLIDFAYIWGVKNISSYEERSLFNHCVSLVNSDIEKYTNVSKKLEDSMQVAVTKGTVLIKNDKFIIEKVGAYFMFNEENVGTDINEAVAYFKKNKQQYNLLKFELGISEPSADIQLAETTVEPVGDGLKTKPAVFERMEKDRDFKETESTKLKISNKLMQIIFKGQDVTADMVKNRYQFLADTGKSEAKCISELAQDPRISSVELQEWYSSEIERVRAEKTPYIIKTK